ncbi:hypothetical protein F511_03915 [Dorcoceras hygrometricum]|uniref:Uncharacterized protein n=1 Tax=Dorcoceras hygrometricum TaxID=472368 RepID=A0A2Z7BWS5_9LAMI|nr:hypothetical protein F511_03915 [Dorcoceras hygrometricum]
MTSAHIMEIAASSKDDVITISIAIQETADEPMLNKKLTTANVPSKHDDVKLVYVVSHTVEAGVDLWSLGVLTAAGCGIGSVHELYISGALLDIPGNLCSSSLSYSAFKSSQASIPYRIRNAAHTCNFSFQPTDCSTLASPDQFGTTTDNTIPQAQGIPRLTVLVHICYTLTGTLYPPPGEPPAGSKPRPAEKPGKPENTNIQQYTSPRGTSGSNPSTERNTNSIRKATDKYANAMQGIKATTESREPKDLNNSSTARSDQRKDRQWPRGILSTWELPTHLQYTVPDAKQTAAPVVAHS